MMAPGGSFSTSQELGLRSATKPTVTAIPGWKCRAGLWRNGVALQSGTLQLRCCRHSRKVALVVAVTRGALAVGSTARPCKKSTAAWLELGPHPEFDPRLGPADLSRRTNCGPRAARGGGRCRAWQSH